MSSPEIIPVEQVDELELPEPLRSMVQALASDYGTRAERRQLREDLLLGGATFGLAIKGHPRSRALCEWSLHEPCRHQRAEAWILVLQGELTVRWKALADPDWTGPPICVPAGSWLRLHPETPFYILPRGTPALFLVHESQDSTVENGGLVLGAEAAGPRVYASVAALFEAAASLRQILARLVEVYGLDAWAAQDLMHDVLPR